jgi:hypothetical protein
MIRIRVSRLPLRFRAVGATGISETHIGTTNKLTGWLLMSGKSIRSSVCAAIIFMLAAAAASVAAAPVGAPVCSKSKFSKFRVYEGMFHDGKPDLRSYGAYPVRILDRDFWTEDAAHTAADMKKARALIGGLPKDGAPIVLDIEHFDLVSDRPVIQASTEKLVRIQQVFRAAAPGRKIGFYGMLPLFAYWPVNGADPVAGMAKWRGQNDAMQALEPKVDLLFPQLYTYYEDREGWVRHARALICEARRISTKPVYVFIWPEYAESSTFKDTPVQADYWALQLDTLYEISDGIVIWDGWDFPKNRLKTWDANAAWWKVTLDRLEKWKRDGRLYRKPKQPKPPKRVLKP